MFVAGKNANLNIIKDYHKQTAGRVFYLGDLDYETLISLYKRSTTFVHLSYLDHCPNVVVDAQAAGCKVICSSTGGTKEVVRSGVIINENNWNFDPIKLYEPPKMTYENFTILSNEKDSNINIAASLYEKALREMISEKI